jgi:hypothetical protein
MPIKGQSPKEVMHTEMGKFKRGTLHSGSKKGPLVKSRAQAIAIGLSESGQSKKKYADGGSVYPAYASGGDTSNANPFHIHIHMPSMQSRQGFAGGGDVDQPAGGGDVDQPDYSYLGDASPEMGKIGAGMLTSLPNSAWNFVKSLVDSAKLPLGSDEYHESIEKGVAPAIADMASQMVTQGKPYPGMGRTAGVFVGPYGAMMLRNAERESGAMPRVHPVYAKDLYGMSPEAKGLNVDYRDQLAQKLLSERAAQGSGADRDIFKGSGWSRGAEGMPKKEIPDKGAKLVKNPNGDGYLLDHPAGDFHKIYDIPPIMIDKSLSKGNAYIDGRNSQIRIAGPDQVSEALHEVQHAIQKKEGFASGLGDNGVMRRPETEQEFFPTGPKAATFPSWQKERYEARFGKGSAPDFLTPEMARQKAKHAAYERGSGETESRNVQRRFENNSYKEHPEDTEDYTRGLQWQDRMFPYRSQEEVDKLLPKFSFKRGGRPHFDMGGGFNTARAANADISRQIGQGMLHSQVPGRTDKLNLNVPSGAYIIPADIPSALGEGNSMAGGAILDKMFNSGPYGMKLPRMHAGLRSHPRASSLKFSSKQPAQFAKGGKNVGHPTPIVAAGGEYVVHPHSVAQLGGGNVDVGHDILDAFVKHIRRKHISTLKGLKPPKGASSAD